ncbi:hypothetical protein E2C01_093530 [Portunus trituberculatus]|uniref:Uncharacterized protein n=1 Tax=Portunus trituberculatus TaxID=210409 RepID=A0A5B7JV24_PORTR|nr:hypothetical protein [Portunus trituberculatus]
MRPSTEGVKKRIFYSSRVLVMKETRQNGKWFSGSPAGGAQMVRPPLPLPIPPCPSVSHPVPSSPTPSHPILFSFSLPRSDLSCSATFGPVSPCSALCRPVPPRAALSLPRSKLVASPQLPQNPGHVWRLVAISSDMTPFRINLDLTPFPSHPLHLPFLLAPPFRYPPLHRLSPIPHPLSTPSDSHGM